MSATDLLEAFEAKPSDHRAFEALIVHLIQENDLETLEVIYSRLNEWIEDAESSPILRVLSQQARKAEDPEIGTFLYFWNGMTYWQEFGDEQKAEMSFRKISTTPPDHEPLREFYLAYYTKQQNWRRLEQFLTDPTKGGMEDLIEVKRMLGRLATEAGQPDRAVGFWQGVRTADPLDEEAESALSELYRSVGKWHAMVDLLKERVTRLGADDPDGCIALYREMIDIYRTHLNAPSKIVATWQSVLEIDAGNLEALDALAQEYEGMNRWPDLVKVLQRKIHHTPDSEKQIALHERIAGILMERFNNASEATKHYQAILDLDETHSASVAKLKEIYEGRRDYESLVQLTMRDLLFNEDDEARQTGVLDLARMASEHIRKPETPIMLWEQVLEEAPEHLEALSALEGLYEREKNYDAMSQVQLRRVELLDDPAERIAVLDKLGILYSGKLNNADAATEIWKRLLSEDPSHQKAQTELRKKYTAERDWEQLEWFFRTYSTVAEWIRTLESQLKKVDDPEEKQTLLLVVAKAWLTELDDQRRAVKSLEGILELDPSNKNAAEMLIPIYREISAWKKLPAVYEVVLEVTNDPHDRLALLLAKAEVLEAHLRDAEAAFFAYLEAIQSHPNNVELYGQLRRLAEKSKNWEVYTATIEDTADLISDEADRAAALLDLGLVYMNAMHEPEAALDAFSRVIALDDGNRAALDAMESLHRASGAHESLVEVLQRQLAIASDSDRRKALLFSLAQTWRDDIGDAGEAEQVFVGMLDEFHTDTSIHDALVNILMPAERYGELGEILALKRDVLVAEEAAPATLADVECQLGMLAYGVLDEGQRVSAALSHYERALGLAADHAESIRQLEALLADEDERLHIATTLAAIYERRSEWDKLADALEIQALSAEELGDPVTAAALIERLALLYTETANRPRLAWRSYARLLALDPARWEIRDALEALTDAFDRWDELVGLYSVLADEAADGETRLAMRLTVARTHDHRLDNPEAARTFYQHILEEDPNHSESLDALERLFETLAEPEDLLEIYRKKSQLTEDTAEQLSYLFRMAEVLADRLERPDEAIDAIHQARALQPDNAEATERLDALLVKTEQWDDLASLLDSLVSDARDDDAIALMLRRAELTEHKLGAPTEAITRYGDILALAPGQEGVVAALERLFDEPDFAGDVAPLLQPVYEARNDWQRLIGVFQVRVDTSDTDDEQIAWHYKIAALYEGAGETPELAFEHYVAAAVVDPGRESTLDQLLRLADILDCHRELVGHMQALVDEIHDDMRRRETHRILAGLCRDRAGDLEGTEMHLRALLEIDERDMPAIDALIQLYRGQHNTARLIDMLLSKAPMVDDQAEGNRLFAEAGSLCATDLETPDRAIEIYESLHQRDRDGDVALNALEVLYQRVSAWDRLVDVYRQKIEREEETEARKRIAAQMATIQATHLEATDDAIQTWRTVLSWDEVDVDAMRELDTLMLVNEDWYGLKEILGRLQPLVDTDEWAELQYRLAKLHEDDDQLADIREAIQCHEALLARAPQHEDAIDSLEAIITERDERELAFEVLRPVLAAMEAWERLWAQYQVLAHHSADMPQQLLLRLHEMATLADGELADPSRAYGALDRAFRANPRHSETVERIEALATREGILESLVALYQEISEDADDDLALQLRLRMGAFLMEDLDEAERAVSVYILIREDDPDHLEALSRLAQLYRQQSLGAELADILRSQVDVHHEPGRKITLLSELATVKETQLSDASGAHDAYIEILDIDRSEEGAISALHRLASEGVHPLDIAERLESVYTESERWQALHGLLEIKLGAVSDEGDQLELSRQLAELNLRKLDNKANAITWYGRSLVLDPDDSFLLEQLTALTEETERWADLRPILMDAAGVADDSRKVELWGQAADINRVQLDDAEEAERVYRLVLELDGEHASSLRSLDGMLVRQARWADLEPVLIASAEVAEYDEERVTLLMRLAALYRDELSQPEEAIAALSQVLDLNDMHRDALTGLEALYRSGEQWTALFETEQRLAETSREDSDRVHYLSDMARLAEVHLDAVDNAIELLEEVLMVAPSRVEAVHELQRLLAHTEAWEALVESYERELRIGVADARALELHKLLGRTLQGRLDEAFRAMGHWEQARTLAAEDEEVLGALRELYREGFNFEKLVDVLRAKLASGQHDEAGQLGIWRELAELFTESINTPPDAIDAWEHVLELAEADSRAIEALEILYRQEQQWAKAVSLGLLKVAHTEPGDAQLEIWMDVAQIQEQRIEDPAGAASTYRTVLNAHPSNLDAGRRLEKIYRADESWEQLAELLYKRTEHLEDAFERLQNLRNLAQLAEHQVGDLEMAFSVIVQANEQVPDDIATLEEAARLAEATGEWEEMVAVYDGSLDSLEGDIALDVAIKAATIVRDRLEDSPTAVNYFVRVLSLDEDNEIALRALVALNESLERWGELVVALSRLSEVSPNYNERLELMEAVADCHEVKLGDGDAAVAAWYALFEVDEMHRGALKNLERLHQVREEWPKLIKILDRIADAEPSKLVELHIRVGAILDDNLQDDVAAIERFEEVLSLQPDNLIALERLEVLYVDRDDWEKLIDVFERSVDAHKEVDQRIDLALKIATIQREIFKDSDSAADWYNRILTMEPGHGETIGLLEAVYTGAEQWEDLVYLLERKHGWAEGAEAKSRALLEMAAVHHEKLDDIGSAIRAFERALEETPSHRGALDTLQALYAEEGLWDRVIDTIRRKLEIIDATEERIALMCTQGKISHDEMMDVAAAAGYYDAALLERPGHPPAIDALIALYTEEERYEKVIETLEHKLNSLEDEVAICAAHVELATVWREQLDNREKALEHLEAGVDADPMSRDALMPLADHYIGIEGWIKAMPLLERIPDVVNAEAEPQVMASIHRKLAQCAKELLDYDRALDEYRLASEHLPEDPMIQRGLGGLYYRQGEWAQSEAAYEAFLRLAGDDLTDEDFVRVNLRLGECATKTGHTEQANSYLMRVLDERPNSVDAIRQVSQVCEAQEQWDDAITYKRQLLDLLQEPFDRFSTHVEIGDIFNAKLNDLDSAVDAYEAALDQGSFNKTPMLALVQIEARRKNFPEAIRWLERLIETEEDPKRKADKANLIALMYRDEIGHPDEAARYFGKVLDYDLSKLEAFRAIDELLTKERNWSGLEQAYVAMLERVNAAGEAFERGPALSFTLNRNLGEVYRSRLRDVERAIGAYEAALAIRTDDTVVREILLSLYEASPTRWADAVNQHRYLVAAEPDRFESYHRLFQLYVRMERPDAAWCVAGLLCGLDQANPDEESYYHEHVDALAVEPSRNLDDASWEAFLISQDEDRALGQIFGIIYAALGKSLGGIQTLKDFGLKKKDKLDLDQKTLLAGAISGVGRTLGLPMPEAYIGPGMGMELLPTMPPVLRIGQDMTTGHSQKDIAFHAAKQMSYTHPTRVMATLYQREQLDQFFMAAFSLIDPNFQMPVKAGLSEAQLQQLAQAVGEIRAELDRRVSPQQRKELELHIDTFRAQNVLPEIGSWHRQVELTANHAALFVCGDIEMAERLLAREVVGSSKLGRGEKLKDLVYYVLSDRYADARRTFGLTVHVEEPS
ncbi:MAG: tetratricopeptide repeat protein [Myxococcota bacterium]